MKKTFNHLNTRAGGFLLAAGLVLAGSAVAFDSNKAKVEHPSINVPMDESAVARDTLPHGSYASVVKKVTPAVVKIVTTSRVESQMQGMQGGPGMDDFWKHFFGDQFGQQQGAAPRSEPQIQHGLGSGVIVTKDGYILTNNHVVDGAKEVKVTLQDGREFTAKVIGRDPKSDVAVVKIEANDLPTVPLADSEKVEIGDVVLAVGNPFGVGQTVTSGIVSAKDRGNMGIEDYEDFIQTDAAINPGNSGGALVDINGRLIGINTAIMSRSGGSVGVGFAIPSNLARTVMASLVETGHVTRGYLGVAIQSVTPDLAEQFKLKDNNGALISDVVPNGPAAKAGLQNGDVVTQFNNHPVTDSRRLQLEVAGTAPGKTVPVEILRDGAKKTLDVTVKELPGNDKVASADQSNGNDTGTLNGVEVADLDQQAHEQFNIPNNVKGAVVTQVDPGSAAAEAGLKPGAVIQEIDRKPVKSADEAVKMTEKSDSKRTLVRVWENGGSHYVVVDESHNEG